MGVGYNVVQRIIFILKIRKALIIGIGKMKISASKYYAEQLEKLFKHTDYIRAVNKMVSEITQEAKVALNEATIETRFEQYLTLIFDAFFDPLGYKYLPQKEYSVNGLRTISKGRADTSVGNVIIEFKQPRTLASKRDKDAAIGQAIEYVDGLNVLTIQKTIGFITDGVICAIYSIDADNNKKIESFSNLSFHYIDRVIKAIVGLNQKIMNSETLVSEFASPIDSPIRNLAITLFETIKNKPTPKTRMLLTEWKHLFKLSHNDFSQQQAIINRKKSLGQYFNTALNQKDEEYSALFALQTAYSVLIKLIAFKVVSQIKYDDSLISYAEMIDLECSALQNKMADLESGSIIRDYGIQNLLEGDFFSWYATQQQWDELIAEKIKEIIIRLDKYTILNFFNTAIVAKDFFKNLYQTVMPESVRHSLGEFYTPFWLANQVTNKAIELFGEKRNWRALDPTCGSGTFITVLINKVMDELQTEPDKAEILRNITSRVIGIDMNPLAVLTARVNYFLNIAPLISFDTVLEIPIYSGDSAYTPEVEIIDNISFVKYSLDTDIAPFLVYFPQLALRNLKKFSQVMTEIELDILNHDGKAIFRRLIELVPAEYRNEEIIKNKITELSNKFVEFEQNQWNGIWARIITNYLTTSKIGEFDIVVGNPPWVDWKNLPSQYREKIKTLNVTKTIFSGDSFTGGINLNIAALITNVVINNWLSKDGVLGMLMPDTFLVQKTYEGYRRLILADGERAYFVHIDDWTNSGDPFIGVTQQFYTYFIARKEVDYSYGIGVNKYLRKIGINSQLEDLDFHNSFTQEKGRLVQLNKKTTNFTYISNHDESIFRLIASKQSEYKAREGIEIYPQELMIFEVVGKSARDANSVEVQNIQVKRSKFKMPCVKRLLEKKYLHPLIRGVDIEPFHAKSHYVVPFVYDKSYSTRVAIEESRLRNLAPQIFRYFSSVKNIFISQNAYSKKLINGQNIPYYSLARVGDYTFAPVHVVFRDNTKNVAAVVSAIEMPWGEEKTPVFQNHAVTISQRPDGEYITLREAYYIAGIINSDIVTQFVTQSSDSRSFPINPRYQIPLYGIRQVIKYQNRIALLSAKAHESYLDKESVGKLKKTIEQNYLEMLRILDKV